jgi:pyrroline-5-carboxylate reductase
MNYELGFIGAGNMAEAIARGVIERGLMPVTRMFAADPAMPRRSVFQQMGVTTAGEPADAVSRCTTLVLAVKPQVLPTLGDALQKLNPEKQSLISIMAGITTAKIESLVGRPVRVVRVMPNTPLMVGKGMSGIAAGQHAREEDVAFATKLFGACGEAVRVDEAMLDAVTAVSGSGPAYVFFLAEAMQQAAEELGLGQHAELFVRQTIAGASELLHKSPDSAADLRRKVTSPGGTTQAAISHFQKKKIREAIMQAIQAAADRSRELGQEESATR